MLCGDTRKVKLLVRKLVSLCGRAAGIGIGKEVSKISAKQLAEHFTSVFKKTDNGQGMTFGERDNEKPACLELDDPPTYEEIEMAIAQLSAHKAPGANNIPAEAFKLGGRDLITRLVEDYKACWPSSADSKTSLFQNWRERMYSPCTKVKAIRRILIMTEGSSY
jgi:hypothetical protein